MDIEVCKFTRVVRWGTSVGSLTDFGGVGRGDQGWGRSTAGCSHVDQDMLLLAGVARPAGVTVCEDSHGSPCVGGDAVLFRPCWETPSSGTCWDTIPGRSCLPCWPGWPVCYR